jgi:Gpi18-like mannosyltransferase
LAAILSAKLLIWAVCGLWTGDWSLLSAFHKWDSYWYAGIVEGGYDDAAALLDRATGQTNWAFFPAYPLIVFVVRSALSISTPWAMELLSIPIALWCLVAARPLFIIHGGNATHGLLTFLLWPFSLFLFVHYSDALFVALVLSSLVAIERRRLGLAAACLALLAITRPNGLFFLPVGVIYWMSREAEKWNGDLYSAAGMRRLVLLISAPVLSFCAWCAFQWSMTGNAFAFSYAQAGWGRKPTWPWESLFNSGGFASQFESWYTVVLVLASVWCWRRWEWAFRIWLLLGILGPMLSGSVDSMTRFAIAFFPLTLALARYLSRAKRPGVAYAMLILLQLLSLALWAAYHPLMA